MLTPETIKHQLRSLKSLQGPFKPNDLSDLPDTPQVGFLDWLDAAIAAGIAEPHAMTLSTVDESGYPDARVLILKNVDDRGWHFAASAGSPKGLQIEAQPAVALTFYWQKLGRQVRIRGRAIALDPESCAQDFLERSLDARAGALSERQSDILDDPSMVESATAGGRRRLAENPDLIAPGWRVYAVEAEEVEFWQGSTDRLHKRLRFRRVGDGETWRKKPLWP